MIGRNFYINCLNWGVLVLKKQTTTVLVTYNNSKKTTIPVLTNNVYWILGTNGLEIQPHSTNPKFALLQATLSNFLFSLHRLWFSKISFKGKGFKIKKRRRTKSIKFFFYHSHMQVIIFKNAKFKQKRKNKVLIKTWNKTNHKLTEIRLISIRPLNVFTKRGLRLGRQIVIKKTGKKSNY